MVSYSSTTFDIYIAKRCFTQLVLTTTCLDLFNSHHQVVHFLVISRLYSIQCFVFVDVILFTSIKFASKIITVAVKLKIYSNIKDIEIYINYIKSGRTD